MVKPLVVPTSETFLLTQNTTYLMTGDNETLSLIAGSNDRIIVQGHNDTVFLQGGCPSPTIQIVPGVAMNLELLGPIVGPTSVTGWTSADHITLLDMPDPYGISRVRGGTELTHLPYYSAATGLTQTGTIMFAGAQLYPWQISDSLTSPPPTGR